MVLTDAGEPDSWADTLQEAGLQIGSKREEGGSPNEVAAAVVACLSVEDRVKEEFLQGYCLFQLAAHWHLEASHQFQTQAEQLAALLVAKASSFVAQVF